MTPAPPHGPAPAGGPGTYRDRWGIPHLWAESADQLAHLQGLNAATDRSWQIELERWRSEGRTAEMLGADGLHWDRFARQARLDDTARRCFEGLDDATRRWCESYVAGINQALDRRVARRARIQGIGHRARAVEPLDAPGRVPGTAHSVLHVPQQTLPRARRHDTRPRGRGPVQHRGPGVVRQQRVGRARLGDSRRQAAHRRRSPPPPGAARRVPAGAARVPGVRRRWLRFPGCARAAALRPHRTHRMGHHQRHGRLPGPLRGGAAAHPGWDRTIAHHAGRHCAGQRRADRHLAHRQGSARH